MHRTTKDRTFMLEMVRQTHAERREKFRYRKVKPEADLLQADIREFILQNERSILELYGNSELAFPYLSHLRDRTIDIVEPLAAILEAIYLSTPELPERRVELLEAVSLTRKDGEEFLTDHRTLRALLGVATTQEPLIGSASELVVKVELNPAPTEYEMAATLRRYGFESRSIRIGESVRYRYELTQQQLSDVCARFGCVTANAPRCGEPTSRAL